MEEREGTRQSHPQLKGAPWEPDEAPAGREPSDSRGPGPAASLETSPDLVLTHQAPLQGRTSRARRSADKSSISIS